MTKLVGSNKADQQCTTNNMLNLNESNSNINENDSTNTTIDLINTSTVAEKIGMKNFELLKMLGTGAYGKVFLVRKLGGNDHGKLYAMKVLKKASIVQKAKTTEHIKTERQVLASVRQAPFLCKLYYAFQTDAKLHLILEYIRGGELFTHLFKRERFHENEVRIYIGEITLALEHLHNLGIIYRDIKLENILLDHEGHICLCDFGLSKEFLAQDVDKRTYSFCGTIEYMAPELIQGDCGHNFSVDWWSLGVLTYELLTGASPFTVEGEKNIPADISKRILKSQPPIPRAFSKNAKDFILKLLNKSPLKRLGANGAQEIKEHPFFDSLNWADLANKKIPAPFKPNIRNELDTNNFADEFTRQDLTDSPAIVPTLNNGENLFRGYSYVAPSIIYSSNIITTENECTNNKNGVINNNNSVQQTTNGLTYVNNWLKSSTFNTIYEVDFTSNLGEGSFSVCKKCRHRQTGKYFAVKIISRRKYDSPNEVRYLTKCQGHENIVKLYDVLVDDLHTYIIMELLSGGELFDRISHRSQFSEKEAASIMKSLISAIQFIHSQGIVHRDLKPENIIFSENTPQAKVKIIDFGFARLKPDPVTLKQLNENKLLKQTAHMMQTPCFTLNFGAPEVLYQALYLNNNNSETTQQKLAPSTSSSSSSQTVVASTSNQLKPPEQTIQKPNLNLASYNNGYDESCDLWSLGVILYTMLCGRVPFSGDYTEEITNSEEEYEKEEEETHDQNGASTNKKRKKMHTNDTTIQQQQKNKLDKHLVTQEKIIERIRNASSSLDFKEKSWQTVSESGKQLLRGLLNVDPKKRMKLKDLSRHEWIKSIGGSVYSLQQQAKLSTSLTTGLITPTSSMCSSSIGEDCTTNTTLSSTPLLSQTIVKPIENTLFRTQINLAFNAFHTAEEKGLFSIQLKDVFEAPLAQRRHHKRSTSSNASSESNISTISICSSLSTSTTNNTATTLPSFNSNTTTPTKKCPLSCGKPSEQTVFNFNESYVTDYLKQQKNSNNLVFNRPITRSFTHHTNKLNINLTDSTTTTTITNNNNAISTSSSIENNLNGNLIVPPSPSLTIASTTVSFPSASVFNFNFDSNSNNSDINQTSTNSVFDSNSLSDFSSKNNNNNDINNSMNPPLSKRIKRVSTILIDD
jgi:ribosomal protein S6 kinase alpha-5